MLFRSDYKRTVTQNVKVNSALNSCKEFLRKCVMTVSNTVNLNQAFLFLRKIFVDAGSIADTTHKAEYYRFNSDTVQAQGIAKKGLLLFVRIVTQVFIRDYLLGRFLKSREELILKSVICREIVLESRID